MRPLVQFALADFLTVVVIAACLVDAARRLSVEHDSREPIAAVALVLLVLTPIAEVATALIASFVLFLR